jgi:single-stranded-DNA-specific exonuclease
MNFRWLLAPAQPALAAELAASLDIPALLAQCLLNRGVDRPANITGFLEPRLKHLADPFLLPNMTAAVDRLFVARQRGESVTIFGDYDVDGVTSAAILLEVLRALGWSANCYLPHRMDEGYGLSRDAVENCLRKFPTTLLLAVDCGSTTVDTVAWLGQQGVDVLVLDHHQVSSPPPAALALVNPQLAEADGTKGSRPFLELCSAGLAFKFAHALVKRGRETSLAGAADFDLRPLLDLVALGTIADIVPLTAENRILVAAGLERLNTTQRPGLVALKKVAQCPSVLGVYEVAFQLAPRLNAAGRLETAAAALRLLVSNDPVEAALLAQNLDGCNRERQQIERTIADQAIETVRATFKPETHFVIVEGQQTWHVGVVGIVASRVLQQFYRPTIIIGSDGVEWRGSGRSIAGFDLAVALRECSDLLVRHGGHAMAAGLTIEPAKLELFRARLNELARRALPPEVLQPPLRLDAEVALHEITLDSLAQLARLKPTGQGNLAAQFVTRNVTQQRPCQRMGADKQHLKMWITDGRTSHEAVWWGAGTAVLPAQSFDVAFMPQVNEYQGRRSVQLKVLDLRPVSGPVGSL